MELQQEISLQCQEEKVGKVFRVIIDRLDGEYYVARTEFDSPEVDPEVLIPVDSLPTESSGYGLLLALDEFEFLFRVIDE